MIFGTYNIAKRCSLWFNQILPSKIIDQTEFKDIIKWHDIMIGSLKVTYSGKFGLLPRSGGPLTIQTPSEPLTK